MGVTCEEFDAFNCSSLIRKTLVYKLIAVQWTGLMLGFQVWVYAISRKGIEHLGITLVLFSLWTSSLGKKTESSWQLHLWNLNICIEKVDAKCWLVEMTLVMTSLPLARVFQCLFTLCSFPLCSDWWKSDSSVDREPQGNWRWNSNFRDIVATSSSFPRPAARAP